ncbi:hypothetical protein BO70DRAFT_372284 [Aspergillus heteromorphus CBS 117.55]|uniref:Uncharacterized protein n=1 Tax=Aspergillus heteromorphus CBS 117.55 TaxID=1448321 RepID=A0A317VVE8_9EURO|nr:uncharacterized protein BO70DRAFT_372284 [Aspergillus heteromorphus CBS 117.55]PWY76942.1 hypothetical protein BO70DRAFT_372284 [Aspergillus heteromorphus CBS 117.55]
MADDAPAMDEFAQTRGGDDLFDDEIIPVPAAEQQPQPEVHPDPPAPAAVEKDVPPARTDTPPRSRGGEKRGRGRGGRGRGGRRGSHSSGRRGDGPVKNNKPVDSPPENDDKSAEGSSPATPTIPAAPVEAEQNGREDATESDPKQAATAEGPRVPAVRGDRSATGGIKKVGVLPKLTEEQLSRRIAAAKENSAKLAAAHARAEADQQSFLDREKVAEEKRRQERANRQVMDNERERNRQRKMNALNGREWDAEKREETYNPRGGRGQFRRGMHGGVSGYARREFDSQPSDSQPGEEPLNDGPRPHHPRGRGRGGRGGRGRGGHRGPRGDLAPFDGVADQSGPKPAASAPAINNEANFPALPGSDKKEKEKEKDTGSKETAAPVPPPLPDLLKSDPLSPVTGASWAEQVESQ